MTCEDCGPVHVEAHAAELHVHRTEPVRFLHVVCPRCGDLLVSADPGLLDAAERGGARRRELLPQSAPLCEEDVDQLRAALEAGWPFDAVGEPE